jgi:hypothetical protein
VTPLDEEVELYLRVHEANHAKRRAIRSSKPNRKRKYARRKDYRLKLT